MSTLITYKIVSDEGGRVKKAARTACNFWNSLIEPRKSVVVRLGVFREDSGTIAQAWEPHVGPKGLVYGRVEFNAKYLVKFSSQKVTGTIVHEIGHTLGIGWEKWMKLYDERTGEFLAKPVKALPALEAMRVELDGGDGTAYSHWDEETFGGELMTGYQNPAEHVLPVTVAVMTLLGHKVKRPLARRTSLAKLLRESAAVEFTRKLEAKALDLDHFKETKPMETIPHRGRT